MFGIQPAQELFMLKRHKDYIS